MARVAVRPGEAGQRSEPWQRAGCVREPCSPPLPTCRGATLRRCAAKRDAPQCHSLQVARDKGIRPNRPVPTGYREKARLRCCAAWQGMALAFAPRLVSIAFSRQRGREISVSSPAIRYPAVQAGSAASGKSHPAHAPRRFCCSAFAPALPESRRVRFDRDNPATDTCCRCRQAHPLLR